MAAAMAMASSYRVLQIGDGRRPPAETWPAEAWSAEAWPAGLPDRQIELCRVASVAEACARLASARYDKVEVELSAATEAGTEGLGRLREMSADAAVVLLEEGPPDEPGGPKCDACRTLGLMADGQDIAQSRLQFEQLLEVLPDALIVVNAGNEVEFVNRAAHRLFGKAREDFLGEQIGFAVREGEIAEIEIYRDGQLRHCEVRTSPCQWKLAPAQLVVIHDVTEQKRLNEQFRQAQKMEAVGVLAGGIAHDFNNLLLVMMVYAEMVRDACGSDDPQLLDATEIIKAVDRGRSLTQQLLAFSRKQPVRLVILDLGVVMSDTQKMLRRLLPSNIEIVSVVDEGNWPVLADRGQIEQVLMNLALNARDAMPRGGRLTIVVANRTVERHDDVVAPGDYVVMSVIDTGTGIRPADLELIFDPFFTTKQRGSGTGLGLAMCYGVVKQAGGHISATSRIGEGTSFVVLLPRAGETTPQQEDEQIPVHDVIGRETILLVEDNYLALRATALMLQRAGYSVVTMANGDEAFRFLQDRANEVDLVLSDVVMPQLSGPELAQHLASTHPALPVVFMTGYSNDPIVGETGDLRIGGRRTILKPFKRQELLLFVREALDRKRSQVHV